jgi:hypothetical protein
LFGHAAEPPEQDMLNDVAMVVVAIAVIGWGLGSWLIPVSWIALVGMAVLLGRVRWEGLLRRLHQ